MGDITLGHMTLRDMTLRGMTLGDMTHLPVNGVHHTRLTPPLSPNPNLFFL